jgi:hypothetical protein
MYFIVQREMAHTNEKWRNAMSEEESSRTCLPHLTLLQRQPPTLPSSGENGKSEIDERMEAKKIRAVESSYGLLVLM